MIDIIFFAVVAILIFYKLNSHLGKIDEQERENIINKLKTDGKSGWHSFDIWLAWNYHDTVTLLTSKESLAYQLEGYSVLDYNEDNLNVKK